MPTCDDCFCDSTESLIRNLSCGHNFCYFCFSSQCPKCETLVPNEEYYYHKFQFSVYNYNLEHLIDLIEPVEQLYQMIKTNNVTEAEAIYLKFCKVLVEHQLHGLSDLDEPVSKLYQLALKTRALE